MSTHTSVTCSGKSYDFLDPKTEQIDLHDIAQALSMTCRYNGHSSFFYSVAEHSVLVSRLIESYEPAYAFEALMHDAAEAYVGDVVSPLKGLLPDFQAIELLCEEVTEQKFGLALDWREKTKAADRLAYKIERRHLFPHLVDGHPEWEVPEQYRTTKLKCLYPEGARALFLARYHELKGAQ